MSRVVRLSIVLAINLSVLGLLVVVGLTAHSTGVLAEGGDYLADAAAIGVSLLAIRLAGRPPTARHPLGHPRATALAAMVNGAWLVLLNVGVTLGATWRLLAGAPHIRALPVLIVSAVAAASMLIGALVLSTGEEPRDVNMSAVLLDTAADAAAAAGVAGTGAIILATGGWYWLDPTVALVIAVVIGYKAIALLRDALAEVRIVTSAPPPGPWRDPSDPPVAASGQPEP